MIRCRCAAAVLGGLFFTLAMTSLVTIAVYAFSPSTRRVVSEITSVEAGFHPLDLIWRFRTRSADLAAAYGTSSRDWWSAVRSRGGSVEPSRRHDAHTATTTSPPHASLHHASTPWRSASWTNFSWRSAWWGVTISNGRRQRGRTTNFSTMRRPTMNASTNASSSRDMNYSASHVDQGHRATAANNSSSVAESGRRTLLSTNYSSTTSPDARTAGGQDLGGGARNFSSSSSFHDVDSNAVFEDDRGVLSGVGRNYSRSKEEEDDDGADDDDARWLGGEGLIISVASDVEGQYPDGRPSKTRVAEGIVPMEVGPREIGVLTLALELHGTRGGNELQLGIDDARSTACAAALAISSSSTSSTRRNQKRNSRNGTTGACEPRIGALERAHAATHRFSSRSRRRLASWWSGWASTNSITRPAVRQWAAVIAGSDVDFYYDEWLHPAPITGHVTVSYASGDFGTTRGFPAQNQVLLIGGNKPPPQSGLWKLSLGVYFNQSMKDYAGLCDRIFFPNTKCLTWSKIDGRKEGKESEIAEMTKRYDHTAVWLYKPEVPSGSGRFAGTGTPAGRGEGVVAIFGGNDAASLRGDLWTLDRTTSDRTTPMVPSCPLIHTDGQYNDDVCNATMLVTHDLTIRSGIPFKGQHCSWTIAGDPRTNVDPRPNAPRVFAPHANQSRRTFVTLTFRVFDIGGSPACDGSRLRIKENLQTRVDWGDMEAPHVDLHMVDGGVRVHETTLCGPHSDFCSSITLQTSALENATLDFIYTDECPSHAGFEADIRFLRSDVIKDEPAEVVRTTTTTYTKWAVACDGPFLNSTGSTIPASQSTYDVNSTVRPQLRLVVGETHHTPSGMIRVLCANVTQLRVTNVTALNISCNASQTTHTNFAPYTLNMPFPSDRPEDVVNAPPRVTVRCVNTSAAGHSDGVPRGHLEVTSVAHVGGPCNVSEKEEVASSNNSALLRWPRFESAPSLEYAGGNTKLTTLSCAHVQRVQEVVRQTTTTEEVRRVVRAGDESFDPCSCIRCGGRSRGRCSGGRCCCQPGWEGPQCSRRCTTFACSVRRMQSDSSISSSSSDNSWRGRPGLTMPARPSARERHTAVAVYAVSQSIISKTTTTHLPHAVPEYPRWPKDSTHTDATFMPGGTPMMNYSTSDQGHTVPHSNIPIGGGVHVLQTRWTTTVVTNQTWVGWPVNESRFERIVSNATTSGVLKMIIYGGWDGLALGDVWAYWHRRQLPESDYYIGTNRDERARKIPIDTEWFLHGRPPPPTRINCSDASSAKWKWATYDEIDAGLVPPPEIPSPRRASVPDPHPEGGKWGWAVGDSWCGGTDAVYGAFPALPEAPFWERLSPLTPHGSPGVRYGHSAVVMGTWEGSGAEMYRMVVFGGRRAELLLNDTWSLNLQDTAYGGGTLQALTWIPINRTQVAVGHVGKEEMEDASWLTRLFRRTPNGAFNPETRVDHSATAVKLVARTVYFNVKVRQNYTTLLGRKRTRSVMETRSRYQGREERMYVFGGWNGVKVLNDLWCLSFYYEGQPYDDVNRGTWLRISEPQGNWISVIANAYPERIYGLRVDHGSSLSFPTRYKHSASVVTTRIGDGAAFAYQGILIYGGASERFTPTGSNWNRYGWFEGGREPDMWTICVEPQDPYCAEGRIIGAAVRVGGGGGTAIFTIALAALMMWALW